MIQQKNFFLTALIRILIIVLFAVLLFSLGLIIGYSVIGEGKNPLDVFNPETWSKVFEFVQ